MSGDPTQIFQDLLNLEVNTIIKHNMTAEKAPSVPMALVKICKEYANHLTALGVDLQPYLAPSKEDCCKRMGLKLHEFDEQTSLWKAFEQAWVTAHDDASPFTMDLVHNGWDTFERLRIATKDALQHLPLAERDRNMLLRIAENCARLKHIVQGVQRHRNEKWEQFIPKTAAQLAGTHARIPLADLDLEDRAAIRKIWEMGVEEVVAQTCVQIDGDVITRLSPQLVDSATAEVRALLLTIHRDSVGIGLQHWQFLADTAVKFAESLSGGFWNRFSGKK
jgi:hypothetical protein